MAKLTRTSLLLPEDLLAVVREREGKRGLAPLVRELLERWRDAQDDLLPSADPQPIGQARAAMGYTAKEADSATVTPISRHPSRSGLEPCEHPKRRRQKGQC